MEAADSARFYTFKDGDNEANENLKYVSIYLLKTFITETAHCGTIYNIFKRIILK